MLSPDWCRTTMLNEKQIMAKIAESCNSQTLKSHYTLKVNSKDLQFRYSEEYTMSMSKLTNPSPS